MAQASTSYQLLFEERPGYLYVLVRSENITFNIARSYLGEIAEICVLGGHSRVLVERDIPRIMSTSDLFAATKYLLEVMGKKRVAFVNLHERITKTLKFGILVGTNRGAHSQLFNNTA